MYQCKYCKEGVQEALTLETSMGKTLFIQYVCQGCRHKAEKEMEVLNAENTREHRNT